MMKRHFRVRRESAFTLVELLVVIGIIAVLIGILIPALANAREAANRSKCLSNMRQQTMALLLYVNDNHQWLPPSWSQVNSMSVYERLEHYGLIKVGDDATNARTVWICPSDPLANQTHGGTGWYYTGYYQTVDGKQYLTSYAYNTFDSTADSPGSPYGLYVLQTGEQRKITQIRHSSKTMLFTDSSINRNFTFWHQGLRTGLEIEPWHMKKHAVNISAVDGHAETFWGLKKSGPGYSRTPWCLPEIWYRID